MKAIKENKNRISKLLKTSMVLLLILAAFACNKDDDQAESLIQTQKTTVTIEEVNNCSTSLGDGTLLSLVTPYTAPEGLVIEKMQIKTTVSNGEFEESTNTNFTDTGSAIAWGGCFTFGSQDWVEYEVRLEAADGSLSNPSTIRVNKPNGAN